MHHRSLVFAAILSAPAVSAAPPSAAPLEVRLPPLYDFAGPVVSVGPFSEGLASRDPQRLMSTVAAMKEHLEELPPEPMYVAAIRLYDLGRRDEAVYWFYSAQYRARLLEALLARSRKRAAVVAASKAFDERVRWAVNGYAFCSKPRLLATIGEVLRDQRVAPDFSSLYPGLDILPRMYWVPMNVQTAEGYRQLAAEIDARWDEIQAKREAKGTNARYCQ